MNTPGSNARPALWGLLVLALLGCGRSQPTVPAVVETMPLEEEESWPP